MSEHADRCQRGTNAQEDLASCIVAQLFDAVSYLHSLRIAHNVGGRVAIDLVEAHAAAQQRLRRISKWIKLRSITSGT